MWQTKYIINEDIVTKPDISFEVEQTTTTIRNILKLTTSWLIFQEKKIDCGWNAEKFKVIKHPTNTS